MQHDDENQINEREKLEMLTIEQLAPENHLVRRLEVAFGLHSMHQTVKEIETDMA